MTAEHPAQGWRLFTASAMGALLSPFEYGDSAVGRSWSRASCLAQPGLEWGGTAGAALWASLYGGTSHPAPAEGCACGFRIYPDLDAAAAGVAQMPPKFIEHLTGRADLVLARTDYTGRTAGPPVLSFSMGAGVSGLRWQYVVVDDADQHLLRVEWIRVPGPIYVAADLAPARLAALRKRYDVVQLDGRVCPAVIGGRISAGGVRDSPSAVTAD